MRMGITIFILPLSLSLSLSHSKQSSISCPSIVAHCELQISLGLFILQMHFVLKLLLNTCEFTILSASLVHFDHILVYMILLLRQCVHILLANRCSNTHLTLFSLFPIFFSRFLFCW